jgi:hypothetical protein
MKINKEKFMNIELLFKIQKNDSNCCNKLYNDSSSNIKYRFENRRVTTVRIHTKISESRIYAVRIYTIQHVT